MLRKLFLAGYCLLTLASTALAAGKRVILVGVISDSNCGLKHAVPGSAAAQCVIKCTSNGANFVLVSGGRIYRFSEKIQFLKSFAGKKVEVIGDLTGVTIAGDYIAVNEVQGDLPKNLQLFEGTLKNVAGKFMLETDGRVYSVDPSAARYKESLPVYTGEAVEVVGTSDGNTIHLLEVLNREPNMP